MNSLNPTGWVRPQPYYSYRERSKYIYRIRYGALLILPLMGFFAFGAVAPKIQGTNNDSAKPALALAKTITSSQPVKQLPAVVPPLDNSTALQNVVDSWVANHPEHKWSIAIQGLGDDKRLASANQDMVFTTASVFKLLLTPKLFSQYTVDNLSSKTVMVDGRGETTLKNCVELMLRVSDNPCGAAVGYLLGWSRSNTVVRQLGLNHTNLNNPSGPTSSASDLNLFLSKLQNGQLFDTQTTNYLLDLMQRQSLRSGIPAGCSACSVANKTGDLGSVRHDVAIVSYPGGQYTMAVFTDGASYAQIAQLTSQIQAVMATH